MSKFVDVVVALAKFTKIIKIILVAASAAAYAWLWTWEAGLVMVYAIFVHEYGHLYAAKKLGYPVSGMFFLPFLGAVMVMNKHPSSHKDDAVISLAGPAFGLLSLLPLSVMYIVSADPFWLASSGIVALINMFNLLPIGILDGGQTFRALMMSLVNKHQKKTALAIFIGGIIACSALMFWIKAYSLGLIFLLSTLEIFDYIENSRWDVEKLSKFGVLLYSSAYILLFSVLTGVMWVAATIEGGDIAMKAFFGN